jgi:hypothetical protein
VGFRARRKYRERGEGLEIEGGDGTTEVWSVDTVELLGGDSWNERGASASIEKFVGGDVSRYDGLSTCGDSESKPG